MFTGGRPFVLDQNSDKDGHAKKTLFKMIAEMLTDPTRPHKRLSKGLLQKGGCEQACT